MKHFFVVLLCLLLLPSGCAPQKDISTDVVSDDALLRDRKMLDTLQRDTFAYMWNHAYPSGLVYENNRYLDGPATTGGTGFGIAAMPAAVERGWITREQAVQRLLTLTTFLRDKTDRARLHGAFPHWINGMTGVTMPFGPKDIGADLVETSFLMQGLLIARAYFTREGDEAALRDIITGLWRDVDWNWFTKGENNGLFWHWSPEYGFEMNMKVTGFNEGMVTYVLAAASPTHPITPEAVRGWYSTSEYLPTGGNGYTVEAGIPYTGPLFITHYSYIGLDPRQLADTKVSKGYWVRNVTQTLVNRAYCLESAPKENRYSEGYWGLTSCDAKDFYRFNAPGNESGTVAPTAALSAMPYSPHYSMQVLANLLDHYRDNMWGPYGPYDAFSLRENWFATTYQAIDQLPITCMVENYRSGLLWKLFMSDAEVQRGLNRAGLQPPKLVAGFPEMVVTLKPLPNGDGHAPDACDLRRHPDKGVYTVPYFVEQAGPVTFTLTDNSGNLVQTLHAKAIQGRNELSFPRFHSASAKTIYTLTMQAGGQSLPIRLH